MYSDLESVQPTLEHGAKLGRGLGVFQRNTPSDLTSINSTQFSNTPQLQQRVWISRVVSFDVYAKETEEPIDCASTDSPKVEDIRAVKCE
jgi:hypothetical protein